jgi:hypothetical protein
MLVRLRQTRLLQFCLPLVIGAHHTGTIQLTAHTVQEGMADGF